MKNIFVRLKPVETEGNISSLQVKILFSPESETLFSFHTRVVDKLFPEFLSSIQLYDKKGPLLFCTETKEDAMLATQTYKAKRLPEGKTWLDYAVKLCAAGKNPVFDMGFEKGGMTGSGMALFPEFPAGDYQYSLKWDLGALPTGSSADWTFGEEARGDGTLLQQTFYAAGNLHTIRNGNFAFSFLGEEVDFEPLASWSGALFREMAAFFHDKDKPYHIFARNTSCDRCGGTALTRSYLFLYQKEYIQTDLDNVKTLFAHEMVHNWPQISDEPFGTGTWYTEGCAEYFSLLLPWKLGLYTDSRAAEILNQRAADYYENPCIAYANLALGGDFLSNKEATRVPYGRGMFYLMRVEDVLNEKTGGTVHVEDIVRELTEKNKSGSLCTNEDWLFALKQKCDFDWEEDFAAMLSGKVQTPAVGMFGGRIEFEKQCSVQRQTGEPCDTYYFYEAEG